MVNESEMIPKIDNSLRELGFSTFKEVPLLSKRIDILGVNDTGKIIAIEAKVEKWKRALSQALNYRLCAEEVYIAIWHEYIHRVDRALLEQHCIGLIEVNGTADFLLKTKNSGKIQHNVRTQVLTQIGTRGV